MKISIIILAILFLIPSLVMPHGKHKAPWSDTDRVLEMLYMGDHDPSLGDVHAFYVDSNQDGKCDRVILRSFASDHGTHVIYDDSYEKFLIDFGRFWAID